MTIIDPRSTLSHPCIRFVFHYRCGSPRYCSVLSRQSYAMIGWPRLFRRRVPEYIERMVYRFNHTQEASSQTIMTVLSTDCAFLACGCSFLGRRVALSLMQANPVAILPRTSSFPYCSPSSALFAQRTRLSKSLLSLAFPQIRTAAPRFC
jgi:hypothetical protein